MQNVTLNRDKYIGGSDIPIIMGISPFKTRWELLQEKAGLKEDNFLGNKYTEYGNILEPKIRDYINSNLKDKFLEGKDIIDDIRCHTDGINRTMVLEIKTTSQIYNSLEEYKLYLVQLLFYMKYTKRKIGILAVYERPLNFDETFDSDRLIIFEIDIKNYKDLLEEIDLAVEDFRNDLRRLKENPFLTETELEPPELIELAGQLEEIEEDISEYEVKLEIRDKLKLEIKNKLDELNKKQFKSSKLRITRVADTEDKTIDKFDEERFKQENEKLYNKYLCPSIKKGKAGYLKITKIRGDSND